MNNTRDLTLPYIKFTRLVFDTWCFSVYTRRSISNTIFNIKISTMPYDSKLFCYKIVIENMNIVCYLPDQTSLHFISYNYGKVRYEEYLFNEWFLIHFNQCKFFYISQYFR